MGKVIKGMEARILEEFKKWLARTLFLGLSVVLVFLFTPAYEKLEILWGLPEKIEEIQRDVASLKKVTDSLSGEDRVIRQPRGLSYIEEPVKIGENITMIIVAERTALGEGCILKNVQSLFTDENRIPTAGTFPTPLKRTNLNTTQSARRVEIKPPSNIIAGRVEVYLIMEYDCNGITRFDKTDVLVFQLLEK